MRPASMSMPKRLDLIGRMEGCWCTREHFEIPAIVLEDWKGADKVCRCAWRSGALASPQQGLGHYCQWPRLLWFEGHALHDAIPHFIVTGADAFAMICGDSDCFTRADVRCRIAICPAVAESSQVLGPGVPLSPWLPRGRSCLRSMI